MWVLYRVSTVAVLMAIDLEEYQKISCWVIF